MKFLSFSPKLRKASISLYALMAIVQINIAWATHNASHDCNLLIPGASASRFVTATDGTVADTATGLTWMRCNVGQVWSAETKTCLGYSETLTWKSALNTVTTYNQVQLGLGKNADWRLPNIKELASIVSLQCVYYAIDEAVFPDMLRHYWTSTPVLDKMDTTTVYASDGVTPSHYVDKPMAWTIDFGEGREHQQPIDHTFRIRLVRNTGP
jgi:hypothetical protein